VIAEHEKITEPTEEPFYPILTRNAYRILKCAGCDSVYFQRESLEIMSDDSADDFSIGFADFKEYVGHGSRIFCPAVKAM